MMMEERLEKIMHIIAKKKAATIDFLADELQVSKDTIRRDLIKLEHKHMIKRTHGGATLANREAMILNYDQRSNTSSVTKAKIAREAVKLIPNASSVIFDSSTSVEAIIPMLSDKAIYAITNSLTHAILLAKHHCHEISVSGGLLHQEQLFLYGTQAIQKIAQYTADYTLLGIFAISESGVFIHTEEEGLIKRVMVNSAQKVIALADHTKIGTIGFFKVCNLSDIDVLVTDIQPDERYCKALEENGVDVIVAFES